MKMSPSLRFLGAVFGTLALASAASAAAESAPANTAPAGEYRLDRDHASLEFRINHLGLSNYVGHFMRFGATLQWQPADPARSSIMLTVDPASVRTDYTGDFRAHPSHKDSPWKTFEEEITRDPKLLNTDKFPDAAFQSTRVEPQDAGRWRVHGDLTLLGQTHPVEFDVTLVGQTAKHLADGKPALGLSAIGRIKRSDFGMNYLVKPPLLGDEVTIQFEGEFRSVP